MQPHNPFILIVQLNKMPLIPKIDMEKLQWISKHF